MVNVTECYNNVPTSRIMYSGECYRMLQQCTHLEDHVSLAGHGGGLQIVELRHEDPVQGLDVVERHTLLVPPLHTPYHLNGQTYMLLK